MANSTEKRGVSMVVPLPAPPGVFAPQLESTDPVVCKPETIAHARKCALRLVERMAHLPHTEEAGDALAMAFTILHFTKENAS